MLSFELSQPRLLNNDNVPKFYFEFTTAWHDYDHRLVQWMHTKAHVKTIVLK